MAVILRAVVEARNAVEQITAQEIRKRPTLVFHLASLRSAIRPAYDAARQSMEVLQEEHQKRGADEEPLFTDAGQPIFTNVLAFARAQRALDDQPVVVELPAVRPLRYDQFPGDFPWQSWWIDALLALDWIVVPEDVRRDLAPEAAPIDP